VLPGLGSHLTWESEVNSNWKTPKVSNNFQRRGYYPGLMYHSQEITAPESPASLHLIWGPLSDTSTSLLCLVTSTRLPTGRERTSLLVGCRHPAPSLALRLRCRTHPALRCIHDTHCIWSGRQRGSRLQISSRSQDPSLINMESVKPEDVRPPGHY